MPLYRVERRRIVRLIEHVWIEADSKAVVRDMVRQVTGHEIDSEVVDYADVPGENYVIGRAIEEPEGE